MEIAELTTFVQRGWIKLLFKTFSDAERYSIPTRV